MDWTAQRIAACLARQVFGRELVCPNCTWTGYEADLLVVHGSLRLIDVEIKCSRSDLCADIEKAKWWHQMGGYSQRLGADIPGVRRDWPPSVWKHYYALPDDIWTTLLLDRIPATSGVLILAVPDRQYHGQVEINVKTVRRAKPNRQASPISAADAVDIARLASLRYWDVLAGKQTRWVEAVA